MARPSFYDHNKGISFPFVDGSVGRPSSEVGATSVRRLPLETVVDLGILAGLDIQFDPETEWFYLSEVRRSADQFFFQVTSNGEFAKNFAVEFCRDIDEREFAVETEGTFVQLATDPPFPVAIVVPDFIISGYFVTGDLTPLAAIMSNGTTWTGGPTDVVVENALVRNTFKTYTRSISVMNKPRTRSAAPDGCPSIPFERDLPPEGVFTVAIGLGGDVRLKEGYNSEIIVNPGDNSITIGASVGAGEGEPCDEVPEYPGETPPFPPPITASASTSLSVSGSAEAPGRRALFSGGPSCNELLRHVNGIDGPRFRIDAGRGVRLEAQPSESTLCVIVDLNDLAATCRLDGDEGDSA